MYVLWSLICLLIALPCLARYEAITTIYKMDRPKNLDQAALVFLGNGRVAKIDQSDHELVKQLTLAMAEKSWVQVSLNHERIIESVQSVEKSKLPKLQQSEKLLVNYEPTILASQALAVTLFDGMNPTYSRWSQCYNRAHVWSWELWNKNAVKSMKVFQFYTTKYIREFDFDWWFHVSPFVMVKNGKSAVETVMDFRFTDKPRAMKDWTDVTMDNHATCPVVKNYSDYEQNQSKEYCYLIKTSMYYWSPADLEQLEVSGIQKNGWVQSDVDRAYGQFSGKPSK